MDEGSKKVGKSRKEKGLNCFLERGREREESVEEEGGEGEKQTRKVYTRRRKLVTVNISLMA